MGEEGRGGEGLGGARSVCFTKLWGSGSGGYSVLMETGELNAGEVALRVVKITRHINKNGGGG